LSPHFECDPDPPIAGKNVTITYVGPLPASCTVDGDGGTGWPTGLTFPSPGGKATFKVPDAASSFTLHDNAGQAPNFSRVVG
jgi:hypothetical protein